MTVPLALRTLVVALVAALVVPSVAAAHASLESTSPAGEEVLDRAPAQLTLSFGGPVTVRPEEFELLSLDGPAPSVADVTTSGETVVTVSLADELPRGTYALDWTVETDHGDPIRGLLPFHVGARSGGDADARREAANVAAERDWAADRRATLLRIGIPALVVAALALLAMTARPAWRLPAALVLLIVVVVALGLARRGSDDPPPAAGSATQTQLSGGETLALRVDPGTVGANDVVVDVRGATNGDGGIEEVELRATPAIGERGSMRTSLQRERDGRFAIRDLTFPVAGSWTLAITATRGGGAGEQVLFNVPIGD